MANDTVQVNNLYSYNICHSFRTAKVVVYAIKVQRGGRGKAPLILNLIIR